MLQSIVTVLAVAAAAYISICVLALVFQDRLVFFPDRVLSESPESALGLTFDDVTLQTEDGLSLGAWYIPHPHARATLLFCHGNAGNMSHRMESLRLFHELDLSVLMFDYRGYGRSEGRPSEHGLYRDADAAWRYLIEERGATPSGIVVFGRSLGGAVAAELASRQSPAGLVLESTFTSLPEMGGRAYPWLPARMISRLRFDTRARVATLSCPKLVVHSPDDDVIPYDLGVAVHEAAAEPKRFVSIQGPHNGGFLLSGALYLDALSAFLTEVAADARQPDE